MSSNKYVLVKFLAVLTILALSEAKNVTLGYRQWGDHPIQFDRVRVDHQWLRIVKEKKTYSGDKRSEITRIVLIDNNRNGHGASANLISGGPGSTFATVDFKSRRGHSIDYNVEIYGKPKSHY